ncbi:MAG: PD-(D/E)XK nuclease family protein, partial [Planctomycetes bacterium]|nr:PD-(D/E)XK nuclease family protein [Planctomycetota bacterium]
RIMTIHKAKGLEFPIVIVPEINTVVGFQHENILTRHDWGITLSPQKQFEQDENMPISHKLAHIAEKEELEEEDIRKMYVAFTRHKDYLILIGADWRNKNGGIKSKNSYLDKLNSIFNITSAIDTNQKEIKYDRRYSICVEKRTVTPLRKPRLVRSVGLKTLSSNPNADQFYNILLKKGQESETSFQSKLLSPVENPPITGISATALCDFAICPALYRWKYILCPPLPVQDKSQEKGHLSIFKESLDPTVMGTFFHRCMELADLTVLKRNEHDEIYNYAQALTNRVFSEMELDIPAESIIHELTAMFLKLKESPLINQILSARRCEREIAFIYKADNSINITGQIDLLFQDAKGYWHIVDYKSDKITSPQVVEHARRYELQMMLYLIAARKHFGQKVSKATIYFLRTGESYDFTATDKNLSLARQRLEDLANRLLSSIATGQFDRISDTNPAQCRGCLYANLCLAR